MQRDVSAMYVDTPRFCKHYEDRAVSLARFVRDANVADAARQQQWGGAVMGRP